MVSKNMIEKYINNSNQIKIAAVLSYFNIIFNILSGLIYTPWMIGQIGDSDYGLYILATSLITMISMDFGLSSAVSRFISKYRAQEEKDKIEQFLGITYKLYLTISIVIFIILFIIFLFIERIYIQLTTEEIIKFKTIYCIAGLSTVISFPFIPLNGIIISNEKFIFLRIVELIQKISIILFMVISLILGYGLYALVLVNAFVSIFAIIIKLLFINHKINYKADFKYLNKNLVKEIFSFSVWSTIILIAQRLILNITPTVLGIFSGTAQIAIFSVGMTIEGYVWTFANALNGLFLPKVSQMLYSNNKNRIKDIENLMIKVGRVQLIIIGAIIAIFISLGSEFMILWMGENFINSYFVSVFLILHTIITLTQEIANNMLIAMNEIKYRAIATGTTAVISLSLSLILSYFMGAIGAAISIFIGNLIGRVIIMNIIYQKKLGINIKLFFKECHFRMIIPVTITILVGFLLLGYNQNLNMINFIIKLIVLFTIYSLLVWKLFLNNYEKNLILSPFRKIFKKVYA